MKKIVAAIVDTIKCLPKSFFTFFLGYIVGVIATDVPLLLEFLLILIGAGISLFHIEHRH